MKYLMILWLLFPWPTSAGTLYEWVDESGETRYGYRPPIGVKAAVAADQYKKLAESGHTVNCRQLADEHLRVIDREITRLKAMQGGFGPAYELTPEAKQRLINDLLAHRAALVTGRPRDDFAPPDNQRETRELIAKYEREKSLMQETLRRQADELQKQRVQIEQQRRNAELIIQRYRTWYPGVIPNYHR